MKKVIFLLLFPLIAEVLVSCCDCLETKTFFFTNKSLSTSNLDGSGQQPEVSQSASLLKKAYGIRTILVREQLACLDKRRSLFISSAYAFSCGCPPYEEYLGKDSVTAIKVFTNAAFDNSHPAGSEVSDYFKIFFHHSFATIEEHVRVQGHFREASLIATGRPDYSFERDLLLMTPPALGTDHSFKVQFILSDGRILESETPPIKLI